MDIEEKSDKIPFMLMEQIGINEQLKEELDHKDKIIIAMAEQLTTPVHGIDWIIDYFTKKVTKEEEKWK